MIKNKKTFLDPINPNEFSPPKFITFDIETILKDNVHIPYLYCMFDGKDSFSWFTDDPKFLFDKLLTPKYRGYQVYAHNLSKFDIIFIFKYIGYLSFKYNIKIWKRNDKIIMISITSNKDNISITIKDSLLLLPSSLSKLSKNFNVISQKGLEPVLMSDITNSNNSEFYITKDSTHYSKDILKLNNYLEWKDLIIKYCINDCVSLHQILIKFRELIYEHFNLLIDKYPTCPSLAFAIFRSKYLKKDTISILDSKVDKFIRRSFTGGSTDSIIPYGENVYVYDVNSLYPASMSFNDFPIGQAYEFTNFMEVPKDSIWFALCEVSTKKDLHIPYLQIHHNNRTISPNGTFEMVISSIEYYNSLNDYDFKIIKGYHFKKGNLFSKYVTDLYNMRLQYKKSDPMNLIAKLIMNSLYGRFGMKNQINKSYFTETLDDINLNTNSIKEIDNDLFFIEEQDELLESKSNVAIASLVTSYSRVHMQQIKQYCIDNRIIIYYFDTDSIFTSLPLPEYMISNKLGSMKLEYIFKEAVFLGPKIYAGNTMDGTYICKVKGYKDSLKVPFDDMKSLLIEGVSLDLNHIKWFRSLKNANITLKDSKYQLVPTQNKRKLIFENGYAINSIPLKIL